MIPAKKEPKKSVSKRGHPKVHPKKVERLAARGLTQEQICAALGICVDTMIRRKRESSELVEAINRGQAAGIATVANALFEQATKGKNTAAAIFYLKNRAGWKDKLDIELDQTLPAPLVIEVPCIDVKSESVPTLSLNGAQNEGQKA